MADVRLELFDDIDRSVMNGSRVHFYCGSSQALGKVVLMDRESAEKGDICYAQIRLEEEVAIKKDDRFIIRFYSPLITIGGGKVLEVSPQKHKRFDEDAIRSMKVKDEGSAQETAETVIREKSSHFCTKAYFAAKLRLGPSELEDILNSLIEEKKIKVIRKDYPLHLDYLKEIWNLSQALLKEYHSQNSLSEGMNKEEFKSKVMQKFRISDSRLADEIIALTEEESIIRISAKSIAAADFTVSYTPAMEEMKKRIMKIYGDKKYEMPTVEQVIQTEKDQINAKHIIDSLVSCGKLIRLNYQYCIDKNAFDTALEKLKAKVRENGCITLAEFRDIIGTSRKFAVEILEYLDEQKITQKVDDARILV